MSTVPHFSNDEQVALRVAQRRRQLVERLAPRLVVALDAFAIVQAVKGFTRARGVLTILTDDFKDLIDVWTFTYISEGDACAYVMAVSKLGGATEHLVLVGEHAEQSIAWAFQCAQAWFRPGHRQHDRFLFSVLDDPDPAFVCRECLARRPIEIVPTRILVHVEPDEATGTR